MPASVSYPTDSGLLAKAVRRIAATGRRIQAAGGATRTQVRDRSRSAGKRAHAIAAKLGLRGAQRREEAQATWRGSPVNSPAWPSGPLTTPGACWPTRAGRCAALRQKPQPGSLMLPRGGAGTAAPRRQ